MKKFVLFISFLLIAAGFNSCSDDDDNNVVVVDKIIGKWQLDQAFEDGEELELTECEKESTIDFFQNGTFTERDFIEDENEDCIALDPFTGDWDNLGNSIYEMEIEISPEVSLKTEVKVTFTGNKMNLEFSMTDGDDVTHFKAVYLKI